jgi:hypothetical protein
MAHALQLQRKFHVEHAPSSHPAAMDESAEKCGMGKLFGQLSSRT